MGSGVGTVPALVKHHRVLLLEGQVTKDLGTLLPLLVLPSIRQTMSMLLPQGSVLLLKTEEQEGVRRLQRVVFLSILLMLPRINEGISMRQTMALLVHQRCQDLLHIHVPKAVAILQTFVFLPMLVLPSLQVRILVQFTMWYYLQMVLLCALLLQGQLAEHVILQQTQTVLHVLLQQTQDVLHVLLLQIENVEEVNQNCTNGLVLTNTLMTCGPQWLSQY